MIQIVCLLKKILTIKVVIFHYISLLFLNFENKYIKNLNSAEFRILYLKKGKLQGDMSNFNIIITKVLLSFLGNKLLGDLDQIGINFYYKSCHRLRRYNLTHFLVLEGNKLARSFYLFKTKENLIICL